MEIRKKNIKQMKIGIMMLFLFCLSITVEGSNNQQDKPPAYDELETGLPSYEEATRKKQTEKKNQPEKRKNKTGQSRPSKKTGQSGKYK